MTIIYLISFGKYLFLVGAFREKCPTLSVGKFLVFSIHVRSIFCSFVQFELRMPKQHRRPEPQKHSKDPNFVYLVVFNKPRLFRHYETFFEKFLNSIFLIFCNRMVVKKSQYVPPFTSFGTVTPFKILNFRFFSKIF